jgi:hypothetical protein
MAVQSGILTNQTTVSELLKILNGGGRLNDLKGLSTIHNTNVINPALIRFFWGGNLGVKLDAGTLQYVNTVYDASGNGRDVSISANKPSFYTQDNKAYLLTSKEVTNQIRNNTMQGAVVGVVGSGGALPTNWAIINVRGLAVEVVSIGSEIGVDYIDIRLNGTATSTGNAEIRLEGLSQIPASSGQTWNFSSYVKNIANVDASAFLGLVQRTNTTIFVTRTIVDNINTGALSRFNVSGSISDGTVAFVVPQVGATVNNGASYDFTIRIGLPQMELGSYATPVIKTSGSAVTRNASSATIPTAVPASGTILLWDNHLYETAGQYRLLDWSNGYLAYEDNALEVQIGSGTVLGAQNTIYQINPVTKPWFYAIKYSATTVEIWRGDREGNITLALPATLHGGNQTVTDLILNSSARDSLHLNSDILTTDEQLTEEQIKSIYTGSLPIFQSKGYAGDEVDRWEQKIADETSPSFDTEKEAEVRAFTDKDLYSIYDPVASAGLIRIENLGGTTETRKETSDFIARLRDANVLNQTVIAGVAGGYKAGTLYSIIGPDLDVTRGTVKNRVNRAGVLSEVASGVPATDFAGGVLRGTTVEPSVR